MSTPARKEGDPIKQKQDRNGRNFALAVQQQLGDVTPDHRTKQRTTCLIHFSLVSTGLLIVGFIAFGLLIIRLSASAEADYDRAVASWMTRYENNLAELDKRLQDPNAATTEGQQSINQKLDDIASIGSDIRSYHPPVTVGFQYAGLITTVVNRYDQAVSLYRSAVSGNNPQVLRQAQEARESADSYRLHYMGQDK